jgi:hypothetical protein
MHTWRVLQQGLEGVGLGESQILVEQSGQAVLFSGQRLADRILYDTVGRRDDAVRGQVMQECTEDIDRFAIHPGGLLRFRRQVLALWGTAEPIVVEVKDEALLP